MNSDQILTPKYWMVHNTKTDDVFIDTARKCRSDAIEVFEKNHCEKEVFFETLETVGYAVDLFELRIINLAGL